MRRRDEVQPFDRELFNSLRGFQRFDFQAQAPAGFLLRRMLPLQLLELIAVPEQLEVLPGRKEQGDHEKAADGD